VLLLLLLRARVAEAGGCAGGAGCVEGKGESGALRARAVGLLLLLQEREAEERVGGGGTGGGKSGGGCVVVAVCAVLLLLLLRKSVAGERERWLTVDCVLSVSLSVV
jgi:hypothetical protein